MMNPELRHIGYGLIKRLAWVTAGIGICLAVHGCAAHRPAPVAAIPSDTVRTQPGHLSEPVPGILSGIGDIFSTPQGRADRQAVRLARAAVPRKMGKGAVYAVNSKVVTAYKAKAPTVLADSGATVSNAAANAQQQTVRGNDNHLQAKQANPTAEAPGPLAVLANNLTGWIPWAIGGVLVLAVVFRKRLPFIGPFFA